jgi:hypothetical protein
MKMPDPTMPPITSMVASKTPSCRRMGGASKAVGYHTGIEGLWSASCYTESRKCRNFALAALS